jgi:hypothetical protein
MKRPYSLTPRGGQRVLEDRAAQLLRLIQLRVPAVVIILSAAHIAEHFEGRGLEALTLDELRAVAKEMEAVF